MAPLRTAAPTDPVVAILPVVGTFFLATAFYALTAHVAARWVIGETPVRSAIAVGVAPAVVTLGLGRFGPAVVAPLAVLVDAGALKLGYGESPRTTAVLAVVHVLASVALGIALVNLVRLLS